jgi:hypothetical protein
LLQKTGQTDDSVKTLVTNLVGLTDSNDKNQIDLLKNWLQSGLGFGHKSNLFQQRIRFIAVNKIFASNFYSLEEKQKLLDNECNNDNNSDESELARFETRASLADKAIKTELFNKYVNEPTSESLYKMQASMEGFVQRNQLDLIEDFVLNKFPEVVIEVGKKNEHQYTVSFISSLFPFFFVRQDVIDRFDSLIKTIESDSVRRTLTEQNDDLRRFYKAHQLCEQYLNKH